MKKKAKVTNKGTKVKKDVSYQDKVAKKIKKKVDKIQYEEPPNFREL